MKKTKILLLAMLQMWLFLSGFWVYGTEADSTSYPIHTTSLIGKKNPSVWIHAHINNLNTIRFDELKTPDTAALFATLIAINNNNILIRQNLQYNANKFKFRQINDLKHEVDAELKRIEKIYRKTLRYSKQLHARAGHLPEIEHDIDQFSSGKDSLLNSLYAADLTLLKGLVNAAQQDYLNRMQLQLVIEDSIHVLHARLHETRRYALQQLNLINQTLTTASYPPIWKSGRQVYPGTFFQTIAETFQHILASVKFFLEHHITAFLIYRILIFLLCLWPVRYFKKHQTNNIPALYRQKFLQLYPTLASVVMGFAALPIIFNQAPYAFLDFIFITLTVSVGAIFLKEHPYLSRISFYAFISGYVVLKIIHFFTSATFEGRIIFAMAILLIIPMWRLLRQIEQHLHKQLKTAHVVLIIVFAQMLFGWLLVIFGYYPQGKQLFLGALDALILAIILYVTVFTFIDYFRLAAYFINNKVNHITFNYLYIEKHARNGLLFLALLFFISSWLQNTFLFDGIQRTIDHFMLMATENDPSWSFKQHLISSLLIIVAGVYLSHFIKHAVLPVGNDGKTNQTAVVIILFVRLLLWISAGFYVLLAIGLTLLQFAIVSGALLLASMLVLKETMGNVVAGLILATTKTIRTGDFIALAEASGIVTAIGLRTTTIAGDEDTIWTIPNNTLLNSITKSRQKTHNAAVDHSLNDKS